MNTYIPYTNESSVTDLYLIQKKSRAKKIKILILVWSCLVLVLFTIITSIIISSSNSNNNKEILHSFNSEKITKKILSYPASYPTLTLNNTISYPLKLISYSTSSTNRYY